MTLAPTSTTLAAEPVASTIPFDLPIPVLPTDPFGSLSLPRGGVAVSEWRVRLAHLRMLAYYKVPAAAKERTAQQRPIGNQLDKALAIALDPALWEIHDDHVVIIGSEGDRYRVTPEFCQGFSWSSKGGKASTICKGSMRATSGMCKHQMAVEYLRLAQELEAPQLALVPTDDPSPAIAEEDALTEIARAEIFGPELFAILGRIRVKQRKVAEGDVDLLLSADDQLVAANSGVYGATTPATIVSGAICSLTAAEFADLWSAINSDAARDALSLTMAIQTDSSGSGLLAVTGPGLNVAVACMAMPC
ncbi:hypothetical protein K2Z83_27590 [Oscillochloris sp. ZM17-4]|uniref:hypothetical protein n=1 Tax=Oscillochloris sp. ZM17-4 TaxID=2866714 RepID=UPI001C72EF0A|nr:hypothetical protein [Oscillochloris sp. ZM17-4]MBX0331420.1 hypothetical protein [Oscillochloris sp. ZM17-4]